MATIYKITNDVNDKVYIGRTLFSIEKRWKGHLSASKRVRCKHFPLYVAMNSIGVEHFRIEAIGECSDEVSFDRETFWVKEYDSFNNGYNATFGGAGSPYVNTALILFLWVGNMTIKEITQFTGYCKESVTEALKSHGITTKDFIQRVHDRKLPELDMFSKEGVFLKRFKNVSEACKFLNLSPTKSHIYSVCTGKRKTAHGYIWKYVQ